MNVSSAASVATVLLGAGCRGIKVEKAAQTAAKACNAFSQELSKENQNTSPFIFSNEDDGENPECLLHFVLREEDHAHLLLQSIEQFAKKG